MSDHVRPGKSARKEVLRVARKRLKKARRALELPARQRAKGVHQARKRIKELRALLRLVRLPLGKTYKVANRRLRDAARLLSDLRDQVAQVEAWDALIAHSPDTLRQETERRVRKRLGEGPSRGTGRQDGNQAIGEALAMLDEVQATISEWPLNGKGFKLFEDSLHRTLADGRDALATAEDQPTSDNLHAWRKRVKDQWYQTRYLSRAWPAVFELRAAQLKELAQLLGDDHDLAMLQQTMVAQPTVFGSEEECEEIAQLISMRRGQLQKQAIGLGRRLHAESPRALCRRWRKYWRQTHREQLRQEKPTPD